MINSILVKCFSVCTTINIILTVNLMFGACNKTEFQFDDEFYLKDAYLPPNYVKRCGYEYLRVCGEIKFAKLKENKCTNVGWANSINPNGKCVTLYDGYDCSGNSISLYTDTCALSLGNCGWRERMVSLSLCGAMPPKIKEPYGTRGKKCITECTSNRTQNEDTFDYTNYFCCDTEDSWDFCHSRLGQNIFGEFCEGNCSLPDLWLSDNIVVYESERFQGKGLGISLNDSYMCDNIPYHHHKNSWFSISFSHPCIRIYTRVGCRGSWKEFRSNVLFSILPRNTKSIGLCNCTDCGSRVQHQSEDYLSYKKFPTSRGKICNTDCKSNGRFYFWCEVDDRSSWDFCFPQNGEYLFDKICTANCSYPEFWSGHLTLSTDASSNFYDGCQTIPSENQINNDFSISIMQNCMRVYENIGCTGEWEDFDGNAIFYIVSNKLKSFSICNPTFPNTSGISINGEICSGVCTAGIMPYFSCTLANGTLTFCLPREFTDPFGNNCNSSRCDTHKEKHPWLPVLYEKAYFKGTEWFFTQGRNKSCFNTYHEDIWRWESIDTKGMCLRIFEELSCLGEFIVIDQSINSECAQDLRHCSWYEVRSISYCNIPLRVPFKNPVTTSGKPCSTECSGRSHGFSCVTEGENKDLCFPAAGVNYFGNDCNFNCSTDDTPNVVTFYDQPNFIGAAINVTHNSAQLCYNILENVSTPNFSISSIQLKDKCIRLFYNIGCTGWDIMLLSHRSLACLKNITSCPPFKREDKKLLEFKSFLSIQFCKDNLPKINNNPCGISGKYCKDACSPIENKFFSCATDAHQAEFCYPRKGMDYTGQHVCTECGNDCDSEELISAKLRGRPTAGNSHVVNIVWRELSNCYNLEHIGSNGRRLLEAVYSIKLIDINCLQLYDNIGCSGSSTPIYAEFQFWLWSDMCKHCKMKYPMSVSLCSKRFPNAYKHSWGLTGNNCITNCTSRSEHFFTCKTNASRNEFCTPREDLNHFGLIRDNKNRKFKSVTNAFPANYNPTKLCNDVKHMDTSLGNLLSNLLARNVCLDLYKGLDCTGSFILSQTFLAQFNSNLDIMVFYNFTSFKLCDAYLPPAYHVALGYSGLICETACISGGKTKNTCKLKDGANDFCFQRPEMSRSKNLESQNMFAAQSISINSSVFIDTDSNTSVNYIMLCPDSYFNNSQNCDHIMQSTLDENVCFTIDIQRVMQPSVSWISSIKLNSFCVTAYDDIGCTGNSIKLFPNSTCLLSLDTCGWDDQILSISLCDKNLPPMLKQAYGSRGQICKTDCSTLGKPYFWCIIDSNDSWDFCFPRPKQHFFGHFCEDNCGFPDLWLSHDIVLYESEEFQGPSTGILLDNSFACQNVLLSSKAEVPFSLSSKHNCISLYESIGCTGTFGEFGADFLIKVYPEDVKSTSLCNTTFPEEVGFSLGEEICASDCVADFRPYFSCSVANGSLQFCSPRNSTNYMGNHCNKSDRFKVDNTKQPWLPAVYTLPNFNGEAIFLERKDSRRCYNLNNIIPNIKFNSVDVKDFCVVLYNKMGCIGDSMMVNGSSEFHCLENINNCEWTSPASVSYCKAASIELYDRPISINGIPCLTDCTTDELGSAYTCKLGENSFDICAPAYGIDFLGEHCGGSCFNNNSHPSKVEFFEKPMYGGRAIAITKTGTKICHNLPERFSSEKLFGFITSIKIIQRTCVHLYNRIGCTNYNITLLSIRDDDCGSDLTNCNLPSNWLSVQFCSDELPPLNENPCGVSGTLCESQCLPEANTWFSCKTILGTTEPCFPRKGVNYTGEELCQSCKCKADGVLAMVQYSTSIYNNNILTHKTKILLDDVQHCYNFGYDPIIDKNLFGADLFFDVLAGVKCIRLYKNLGCTGVAQIQIDRFVINCGKPEHHHIAGADQDCAKSLSLCSATFPELYKNPVGLTGRRCISDCSLYLEYALSPKTFRCHTNFSRNEFCIPRQDVNHFGQSCVHDNCVLQKPTAFVLLSQNDNHSTSIALHNVSRCYNVHESNHGEENGHRNYIHNIERNISCIILFSGPGCVGETVQVTARLAKNIDRNASCCGLNKISSFRFCDAYLPQTVQMPVGNSGKICKSDCTLHNQPYFSCELYDGSCDVCSPRPGQNYIGQICEPDCPATAKFIPQCSSTMPVLREILPSVILSWTLVNYLLIM